MDHLILHRPVALALWARLFREAALSWGNHVSCKQLFCESYSYFGGNKRGQVLGRCAMMEIFWVLWMEGNKRVFDDVKGEEVEHLWLRVHFLASLWASTSPIFKEHSVSLILLDWNVVVM